LEKFANNELSRIIDVAIFLDKRGVNIWRCKDPVSWNFKLRSHSALCVMLKNPL
jgi:hypothetical protein